MSKDSSIAAQRTPELPGLVKRGRPATGKAKTNAQRQADYRNRKRLDFSSAAESRLNTMISERSLHSLKRLAFHYGVTQKTLLERLLHDADEAVMRSLQGQIALRTHYIFRGMTEMTHPERPGQDLLDAVLAAESAQVAQQQTSDAVTKKPSAKRDPATGKFLPRSVTK